MEPDATRSSPTAWLDERYRQIIEQVEDYAIFTLDNEGFISTWNGGAERILGFSEEEALGQPGSFIFTPEDREQGAPEQEWQTVQIEGKAHDERWHVRKDGSRFYASGILTKLYDDKGNPDGFAKILRDLARQQQAEEEQERLLGELKAVNATLEMQVKERTQELGVRNEELLQSQQRFAQAFQAGPVAACITTLGKETFLEVNNAFLELTGYTKEEVVDRTSKALRMWSSAEDQAKLRRLGEAPFRNQELSLRTRRGEVRHILLSREVIDLGGERLNLKQFYDITERKQGETQLMAALQRVMSDTSWFAQKVMEELAQVKVGGLEPGPRVELSKRERDVLEGLARGLGNDTIAAELGIATQTVRNYISTIYDKLEVHSRGEAIVWARERGIV
jgi:PAS domain S-box-containing protein